MHLHMGGVRQLPTCRYFRAHPFCVLRHLNKNLDLPFWIAYLQHSIGLRHFYYARKHFFASHGLTSNTHLHRIDLQLVYFDCKCLNRCNNDPLRFVRFRKYWLRFNARYLRNLLSTTLEILFDHRFPIRHLDSTFTLDLLK